MLTFNQLNLSLRQALKISVLFAFTLCSYTSYGQYYWVGNTGNWSNYSQHWATTSGGSTFHTTVPTDDDDVFFDENSFTEDGHTVVMDESRGHSKSMIWTSSQVVIFDTQNMPIDILGSAVFQPQVEYKTSQIRFDSDEISETIKTNGANVGGTLYFYGNAEFNLMDDISTGAIWLGSCIFRSNDHDITLSGRLRITGRPEMYLGSSYVICGNWEEDGFEFTFDAGSSTIKAKSFKFNTEHFNSVIYNNLELENNGRFRGSAIVKSINVTVDDIDAELIFEGGETIKCESFTTNSDKNIPLSIFTVGGEGHFTLEKESGVVDIAYVSLQDIHATGGATFKANPGIDKGNNDGWTFTPIIPENYYWIGDDGNWSDLSHWATQSGGVTTHTGLPSKFDNVYIDANSFADGGQLTVDISVSINDFDTSGNDDDNTNISSSNAIVFKVNGDLNLSNVTPSLNSIDIEAKEEVSLILNSKIIRSINLNGGGIYNLNSDAVVRHFRIHGGTFNTNNNNIESGFDITIDQGCDINLGSSEIDAHIFSIIYDRDNKLNAGNSTISVASLFRSDSLEYDHVILNNNTRVQGNSNIFETLEFTPGATVTLTSETEQIITGQLLARGESNNYINISATIDGVPATLSVGSGTVNGSYLVLKDNIATGGATFNAAASIDLGNNTGWNIMEADSKNFYWIGGEGLWSDVNHWAITSGSDILHNDVPSILDNVYFDNNSFTSNNQRVTIEGSDDINIHTMDWTGVSRSPSLVSQSAKLNIYGSLIFGDEVTPSIRTYTMLGSGNKQVVAGKDGKFGDDAQLTFDGSSTWDIESNIDVPRIRYSHGTVNTNGNEIITKETDFFGQARKELNLSTSLYFTNEFEVSINADSLTINGSESIVTCDEQFSIVADEIPVFDMSLGNLILDNPSVVCNLNCNAHIENLTIVPGKEVSVHKDLEASVGALIVEGTEANPIKIHSNQQGLQASISKSSGTVVGEYLELEDIAGVGGAAFYAQNSTNLGNVSGWIFGFVATEDIAVVALDIFPNPAQSIIHIELPSSTKGICHLYNVMGKLISKHSFKTSDSSLEIDIESLEQGVYLVTIEGEHIYYNGKIVRQ